MTDKLEFVSKTFSKKVKQFYSHIQLKTRCAFLFRQAPDYLSPTSSSPEQCAQPKKQVAFKFIIVILYFKISQMYELSSGIPRRVWNSNSEYLKPHCSVSSSQRYVEIYKNVKRTKTCVKNLNISFDSPDRSTLLYTVPQ